LIEFCQNIWEIIKITLGDDRKKKGKKIPLERPKYLCTVKIPPDCSKISVPKNSQYGI
jgi:hypothetical protein